MLNRQGFTLMEIIIVLVIIGVCVAMVSPSFTGPSEQALALTAQNNLLAIYSAQQNYNNSNGNGYNNNANACPYTPAAGTGCWCLSNEPGSAACQQTTTPDTNCADSIATINCNLSLNIQDNGSYSYSCTGTTCTATRTNVAGSPYFTLTLTSPTSMNYSNPGNGNPSCCYSSANCTNNVSACP